MAVRFDYNRRGGLTLNRDSLHESEGYKRQVEALKQLPERKAVMGEKMSLQEAIEHAQHYTQLGGGRIVHIKREAWDTIIAHLTQPAQAVAVEVRPVLVRETPEACQVWLRSGVQQFQVGDACDTREEGEWYAGQLRIALGLTAASPHANGEVG